MRFELIVYLFRILSRFRWVHTAIPTPAIPTPIILTPLRRSLEGNACNGENNEKFQD